jgi:endonuclease YncB( thermonuclease family)
VTDTGVFVRDAQGKTWSFGLIGVQPTSQNPRLKEFTEDTRAQLEERLAGHEVRISITSTNAQRIGFGYLYEGTNQVGLAVELVTEGRWQLHPESGQVLPLKEQMRLRAADRQAQAKRHGLWAEGMPGAIKADTE